VAAGIAELLAVFGHRDELKVILGLNRNASRENLARGIHELLLTGSAPVDMPKVCTWRRLSL
jgi:hypothetical protein